MLAAPVIVRLQAGMVASDSVVLIVSPSFALSTFCLLMHRVVSMLSTPLPDFVFGASQSLRRCLSFYYPSSLTPACPVVGKAQKIERAVTLALLIQFWPAELYELRLRRMDRQAEACGTAWAAPPAVAVHHFPVRSR